MKKIVRFILVSLMLIGMEGLVWAGTYTVAVLDFEAPKEMADLGAKVADLVSVNLSKKAHLKLVERERLKEILGEMGLGLTGIVDESTAAQLGKMVGAKVLITGRLFAVDEELIVITKIIGVETSRVYAEVSIGKVEGKLTPVVVELSEKISSTISEKGKTLVAKEVEVEDRIAKIKAKISGKRLPTVMVSIPERHRGEVTLDPAAETELIYILKECGFTVVEKGAKVKIVGESFSEFGTRRGELVSCKARVEVKAIDRETKEVLAVNRGSGTGVDLSAQSAAKRALQKITQELAIDFIPELVNNWNAKESR